MATMTYANSRHAPVRTARRLHATGGRLLIAAEAGDDRRRGEAGHVDESNGLTDDQWRKLAKGLHDLADNLEPMGMRVVFHNHVGTYVETQAETMRVPLSAMAALEVGSAASRDRACYVV